MAKHLIEATNDPQNIHYPFSNAVDGNTGTYIETSPATNVVITFDLSSSVTIRYFKLFIHRFGAPGEIRVGDTGTTSDPYCAPIPHITSVQMWFFFECEQFLTGQKIVIRATSDSNFATFINEIDVYIDQA